MMTDREKQSDESKSGEGGHEIRFLQKKRRKGGRKVYLMAALLLIGAIVYALWARATLLAPPPEEGNPPEAAAPSVLVDRLWIDVIPQRESDKFNFYIFSSEDNIGLNDKAESVYRHLLEIFFYNANNNQITFQFPHDRRSLKSGYKVEKLSKPKDDVDLQLTIEKDPQNSGKSTVYYSSTKWSSADRSSLPPMLRNVPLEPTQR